MSRKLLDILHNNRIALRPRAATDAFALWNPNASRIALKRSQKQKIAIHDIKSRPKEIHIPMNHRSNIGKRTDAIRNTAHKSLYLRYNLLVFCNFFRLCHNN